MIRVQRPLRRSPSTRAYVAGTNAESKYDTGFNQILRDRKKGDREKREIE
jgi:hypothetical protein